MHDIFVDAAELEKRLPAKINKRLEPIDQARQHRAEPVATIFPSEDGGAVRRIINGRKTIPTGSYPFIKSAGMGMPWESLKAEVPTMYLAEVGSPVISFIAQPHRLEMRVMGQKHPFVYYPDLLLTVEESFVQLLAKNVPFGRAILQWRPDPERRPCPCKLVIEVKNDDDRRRHEPFYREKLRLAEQVYAMKGMRFLEIVRSKDLDCVDMRPVKDVYSDRLTTISAREVGRAVRYLTSGHGHGTFGKLLDALGGDDYALTAAKALHVRRVLSLDLQQPLRPSSEVFLVRPFGR